MTAGTPRSFWEDKIIRFLRVHTDAAEVSDPDVVDQPQGFQIQVLQFREVLVDKEKRIVRDGIAP